MLKPHNAVGKLNECLYLSIWLKSAIASVHRNSKWSKTDSLRLQFNEF